MDHPIAPALRPLTGPFPVPPSKSEHQRALVLRQLAGGTPTLRCRAPGTPGDDVQHLAAALEQLGPWSAGALGEGRASLRLDLGEGATGFRYAMALATVRPLGARTLVTGRPVLRQRKHGTLLRALQACGAHLHRRRSGAIRVVGDAVEGRRLSLDGGVSSQFASTLMLLAPRIGGVTLDLRGRLASWPYLEVTADLLRRFGIDVHLERGARDGGQVVVAAGAPQAEVVEIAPDVSACAAWWSAVALCGGEVAIPGVRPDLAQADLALLPVLERMGATVDVDDAGDVRVRADGGRLRAPGEVDLTGSPDLVFLLGCLGAAAEGETVLSGLTATRGKESDRVAVLARGLTALGADVQVDPGDRVRIRGGRLQGGRVDVGGDHRAAFGFGILGLRVEGVRLGGGAGKVAKSHPGFLEALAALAAERSDSP